jgi:hypothetical protein
MRNPRCADFASADLGRELQNIIWNLSAALPALPRALVYQCVGRQRVEIRALPAMLSPGIIHLERAILSRSAVDHLDAPLGRYSLPLPSMPLQFRGLPGLQRAPVLAIPHGSS